MFVRIPDAGKIYEFAIAFQVNINVIQKNK